MSISSTQSGRTKFTSCKSCGIILWLNCNCISRSASVPGVWPRVSIFSQWKADLIWRMESPPCIDDFPIQTSINRRFPIAMFHYQNPKYTKWSSLERSIQCSHSPHRIFYRKSFADVPLSQNLVKHHIMSTIRFPKVSQRKRSSYEPRLEIEADFALFAFILQEFISIHI